MAYKLKPESEQKFSTEDVYIDHDNGAEQLMFKFQWDGKPYNHYWEMSGWSIEVVRSVDKRIFVDVGHIDEISAHQPVSWTNWDDSYPIGEFLDCARRNVNIRTQIPIQEDDFDYKMWQFYYDTIIKYANEHLVYIERM